MEELLGFFDILINIQGSKTYEAILEDPEVIEEMAGRKDDGSSKVPLFGHTEIVSLLKTLIEVKVGKDLPRPVVPGLELRLQRKITKTNSSVAKAQERDRKRREREAARRNPKGT